GWRAEGPPGTGFPAGVVNIRTNLPGLPRSRVACWISVMAAGPEWGRPSVDAPRYVTYAAYTVRPDSGPVAPCRATRRSARRARRAVWTATPTKGDASLWPSSLP